ncbi:putative ATPase [Mycetocola sp. BIGb0189]|nr:putative ATPase [Mycetocola sp. BIGb0189]
MLSSGEKLSVAHGVTAIVGPNNTGKSSLLREIRDLISTEKYHYASLAPKVISGLELAFEGTAEDLFTEFSDTYSLREPGTYNYGQVNNQHLLITGGVHVELADIVNHWGSQQGLGGRFAQLYFRYLNAEERLGLTNSAGSFDTYREIASSPLQILFSKREMEARLNSLSLEAFKTGVVVNRYAGSMINLHAGEVLESEGTSPQSEQYLAEINSLPLLHDQGDGMRAFVGMVMSIITNQTPLVLIDEPEAFLHPPQARMLGRFLADFANQGNGSQVLIATHSEDIIAGLTSKSSSDTDVSIARLTRNGNTNHVAQLSAEVVHELYEDPLMKHYDMLNGLFATGVVLCEADSDCTYYRATVESMPADSHGFVQEAHFTHASGKARIAQAIGTFRKTAVPVAAIFDIDILQNDHEFNRLIDTIDADPARVSPLRNVILDWVANRVTKIKRTTIKAEIDAILSSKTTSEISAGDVRKIQELVGQKSGWRDLKTAGKSILSGGVVTAFGDLLAYLEGFGVFILESGELERLHPELPQTNKAAWLREVIQDGHYKDSPAASMLGRISSFLEEAQTQVSAAIETSAKVA